MSIDDKQWLEVNPNCDECRKRHKLIMDKSKRIAELKAENELLVDRASNAVIAELRARLAASEAERDKLKEAAQAVVDGLFLAVPGDYHYSQQDTDLIDALKASLGDK
jgi:hypothetical protein